MRPRVVPTYPIEAFLFLTIEPGFMVVVIVLYTIIPLYVDVLTWGVYWQYLHVFSDPIFSFSTLVF